MRWRSSSTIRSGSTRSSTRSGKAAGPTVHVSDWRQRNETFFTVLEVERNVMFIILSLIVLVAALNIISGLMMLVKDKGRDVAILRTMGATRGAMMRVFLITGASIGIVGTLAGPRARDRLLPQHRIDPRADGLDDQTPPSSIPTSTT